MPEKEIERIAEQAKLIASGYAFSARKDGLISFYFDMYKTWKEFGGKGFYEG